MMNELFDHHPVNSRVPLATGPWHAPANRLCFPRSSIQNRQSKIENSTPESSTGIAKTRVFLKSPFFTLLLPYSYPTFTLPPNRHHRFRPRRRHPLHSFRCRKNWVQRSCQPEPRSRAFFQKAQFSPRIYPGFTPDSPCIARRSGTFCPFNGGAELIAG